MSPISRRSEISRRKLLLLYLLPFCLQGCTNTSSLGINPFVNSNSADAFSLNRAEIQRKYDQSIAKEYLAIIGSQLPRSMILDSYWRFISTIISRSTPDTLQGNLASLGYFSAPSLNVLKTYCTPKSPYLGAVLIRQKELEMAAPPCGSKSSAIRIPLGHTMRGFIVPKTNRFATSIPLHTLAELSRTQSPIKWSDINPAWPNRPIRWVFNSQTDFKTDLQIIGITPPRHYQLAASYDRAFLNVGHHPDNLLFSPTSPSLKAQLEGAQFRILPLQLNTSSAPIEPEADALDRYPLKLVRTVYLYINPENPNRCLMLNYAGFLLNNNTVLMNQGGFIPLRLTERQQALDDLQKHRNRANSARQLLCRGS